jgi:predicted TIM-barrel fold metal-dependent hydrolase
MSAESNIKERPMMIDGHAHAWLPEDLIMVRKSESLFDSPQDDGSDNKWSLSFDGTIESLVAAEREAGMDRFVLLPVSSRPPRCREVSKWAVREAEKYPEIIPFGNLHPYSDTPEDDVALLVDLGLRAVKLHSLVQHYEPLSAEAMKLYGLIEKAGLFILMDSMNLAGAVKAKPNLAPLMDLAKSMGIETGPKEIAVIAGRFPGLKIIAAHLGCLYGWDHVEPLYDLDQVYLDLSYIHPLLPPDTVMDMIARKGVHRIVFGTDAPYRIPKEALNWVLNLPLSESDQARIMSGNLLELLA